MDMGSCLRVSRQDTGMDPPSLFLHILKIWGGQWGAMHLGQEVPKKKFLN